MTAPCAPRGRMAVLAVMLTVVTLGLHPAPFADATLEPVPYPNLEVTDEAVRQALAAARADLDAHLAQAGSTPEATAEAFGELGMLYQVHLVFTAAEVCYRNALALDPQEPRWTYYLGYLLQQTGRFEEAAALLRQARALAPDYTPARLRLAEVELELGKLTEAAAGFRASAADSSLAAAALFGLGRIALARQDWDAAVRALEQALAAQPDADAIHYSLALAHRGLKDLDRARAHLEQRGDIAPKAPDPWVEELEDLSTGHRALFHYAVGAVRHEDYAAAVKAFEEGLARDPDNVNARISLARAAYLAGDRARAKRELERALSGEPEQALGLFLMGVWLDAAGEREAAMDHYRRVLAIDPEHDGAQFHLANALMAAGAPGQAAPHYAIALVRAPDNRHARLGEVLALGRSGARPQVIRDRLEAAVQHHPEDPAFRYYLALLLAAGPDETVRDGERALALAQGLYEERAIPEHAELLAMAQAELGKWDEAIAAAEEAIAMASAFERRDHLPRLHEAARGYRAGQPVRLPPGEVDPSMSHTPPADATGVFRYFPTDTPY